jgi:hypothetical protein
MIVRSPARKNHHRHSEDLPSPRNEDLNLCAIEISPARCKCGSKSGNNALSFWIFETVKGRFFHSSTSATDGNQRASNLAFHECDAH